MKVIIKNIFIISLLFVLTESAFSENAGSRGAFTRGGWAGARYVAAAMTGEVLANDVFSIYWNPAGLTELKRKTRLTEEEVTKRARTGRIDEITEEDLLSFSESGYEKVFVDAGVSYTALDAERDAVFTGFAFSLFKGVAGAGFYSIMSTGIETRDDLGNKTGTAAYSGSVAYFSYAYSANVASVGVSLKGIYESIDDAQYAGAGADLGVQVYLLPFFKVGFMARDLGSFLTPYNAPELDKRYDFFYPEFSIGAAITSDAGFRIAFNGTKRLEQTGFIFGGAIEYDLSRRVIIICGLRDDYFSSGVVIKLLGMDVSYAFSFDRIDLGYNNTVSIGILF